MRYFLVFETEARREARTFVAAGMAATVLSGMIKLALGNFHLWSFPLDLLSCVLFLCGSLLWDRIRLKGAASFFFSAFLLRVILAVWLPEGLFAFLAYLPFSILRLLGEIKVLEYYRTFLSGRAQKCECEIITRAMNALARTEITFWVALILVYISALFAFPSFLMVAFSVGVRAWVSYLLFKNPQFLTSRAFFEKSSVRAQ